MRAIDSQSNEFQSQVFCKRCQEIADKDSETEKLSKGVRFIHRFMNLLRRHGKTTWGVYYYKLRGRTGVTPRFDEVIQLLIDEGVIHVVNEIILLNSSVEKFMFDGKRREGRPAMRDFSSFWNPIVEKIDEIMAD
jgi:hypothetical protein